MGWLESFAEGYAGGKMNGMQAVPMAWYNTKQFIKKYWWAWLLVALLAVSIITIYVQKWRGWA